MDLETRLAEARTLLEKGDNVRAYDTVQRVLETGVFDSRLAHLALLGLARSGATRQALEFFEQVRDRLPASEEFLSLEARLDKDLFLSARNAEEKFRLGQAARDLYAQAFQRSGTYYPAINAATLSLLIGDTEGADMWACRVLELCDHETDEGGLAGYYLRATRAEACLLLGRDAEAKSWLEQAREARPWDSGNLSTTYRQLKRICEYRRISAELLETIRPPTVITYTGQMIHGLGRTPGIDPDDAPQLKREIAALLQQHRVRVAYGSLACGADLLVAEALLEAGGELNVILPFSEEEFKRSSVAPAGEEWVRRFDTALAQAASVSHIVEDGITGHDLLFEACSRQGMGMAHLRSQALGSHAYQIAVWNQQQVDSPAGTAGAVQCWSALGEENLVVPVPPPRRAGAVKPVPEGEPTSALKRQMKAMIFADVKGYSGLQEKQLPAFVSRWMKALDHVLETSRAHIQYINTWGDAAYLVIDNVPAAARAAVQMAGLFQEWDFDALGLPDTLGLRVAAHVGPIFETQNPVLGKADFFGMHVNQTARLEPCTPVGSVYVTEPFAALISLEGGDHYRCEYVGNHPLPKNFGRIRMYHLTEVA